MIYDALTRACDLKHLDVNQYLVYSKTKFYSMNILGIKFYQDSEISPVRFYNCF